MAKHLLLSILCVIIQQLVISQEVISNGGNEYNTNNHSISFTIGETFTEHYENSSEDVSHGFHSYSFLISDLTFLTELNEIKIYPNPFIDNLNINYSNDYNLSHKLKILSVTGSVILLFDLNKKHNIIQLGNFIPKGQYFMEISNQNQVIFTSKLIKK